MVPMHSLPALMTVFIFKRYSKKVKRYYQDIYITIKAKTLRFNLAKRKMATVNKLTTVWSVEAVFSAKCNGTE